MKISYIQQFLSFLGVENTFATSFFSRNQVTLQLPFFTSPGSTKIKVDNVNNNVFFFLFQFLQKPKEILVKTQLWNDGGVWLIHKKKTWTFFFFYTFLKNPEYFLVKTQKYDLVRLFFKKRLKT